MKNSLKKKLAVALVAGCSTLVFGNIVLANPQTVPQVKIEQSAQTMSEADFDKAAFKDYCALLEENYSWMYLTTRECVAYNFMSIENALQNDVITEEQANKLGEEVINFYKNSQKYQDELRKLNRKEARAYRHEHHKEFFIYDNLAEISQKTTISEATLEEIFADANDNKRRAYRGELDRRLVKFTNKLVAEGKVTQEEVDVIGDYMQMSRDKLMQMDKQQRQAYLDEYKQMTDEQRLTKMSNGTGIAPERLQEIFNVFKEAIKTKSFR